MTYPLLEDLIPLFPTKAAAKEYRKQVLEYVSELERDAEEIASETERIRAMFPKRDPIMLGDDFIAKWHYITSGGTAVRRNRRRELKKERKVKKS